MVLIFSYFSNLMQSISLDGMDGIDVFERFCIRNYLLIYSSIEDYNAKVKPKRSRVVIAWLITLYHWLACILVAIASHIDDAKTYHLFGFPINMLNRRKELMILMIFSILFGCVGRTLIIIFESKLKIESLVIIKFLRSEWRGKLMSNNYRKVCLIIKIWSTYCLWVCYLMQVVLYVSLGILAIYSIKYLSHIPYHYNPLVLYFFYCFISWLTISSIYCMTFYYFLSIMYLKLRFQQVRERIEKSLSLEMLQYSIREHNEICGMNSRNNVFISYVMFMLYFIVSMAIDMEMFISIYEKTVVLKLAVISL